jgi:hypothetical protein
VQQANAARKEIQVLQGPKVIPDLSAHKVKKATSALLDHKVRQAPSAPKATQDHKATSAPQGPSARKVR